MRFILLLALLTTAFAHGTVYKWVDEDGKVHYSDEPINNAQVVEFKKNTQNQIKLPPPVSIGQDSKTPEFDTVTYRLSITSPNEEATLRDNDGNIRITASIDPELSPSHMLVLYMDGKQVGGPQQSGLFLLTDVDRGEHSFVIKAIAKNGKQLASTPARKVFLHRTVSQSKPKAVPLAGGN